MVAASSQRLDAENEAAAASAGCTFSLLSLLAYVGIAQSCGLHSATVEAADDDEVVNRARRSLSSSSLLEESKGGTQPREPG